MANRENLVPQEGILVYHEQKYGPVKGFVCPEDELLMTLGGPESNNYEIKVTVRGAEVEITLDVAEGGIEGSSVASSRRVVERTRAHNARHNVVAEEFTNSNTDVRLGDIFPDMPEHIRQDGADSMTPDIYHELMGTEGPVTLILEVGTSKSTSFTSLMASAREKIVKYHNFIESRARESKRNVLFGAIVVGVYKIVSNLVIDLRISSSLMIRYFIGRKIEECLKESGIKPPISDTFVDRSIEMLRDSIREFAEEDDPLAVKWKMGRFDTFNKSRYQSDASYVSRTIIKDFMSSVVHTPLEKCQEETIMAIHEYRSQTEPPPGKLADKVKAVVQIPLIIAPESKGVDVTDDVPVLYGVEDPAFNLIKECIYSRMSNDDWEHENFDSVMLKAMEPTEVKNEISEEGRRERAKWHRVYISDLSEETCEQLMLDGLNAKRWKNTSLYQTRRAETQKGYNLNLDTGHVTAFLQKPPEPMKGDLPSVQKTMLELLAVSNAIAGNDELLLSQVRSMMKTDLFQALFQISCIAQEITIGLNQNTKPNEFILKKIRDLGIHLVMHPTGSTSHVFFSLIYDKGSRVLDTSGIFSQVAMTSCKRYYTPLLSINRNRLENMLKAPYTYLNLMIHWTASIGKCGPPDIYHTSMNNPDVSFMSKLGVLISLEDRQGTEIITTETRYCIMELAKGTDLHSPPNLKEKIRKFPKILRSVLQVWLINKITPALENMIKRPPILMSNLIPNLDDRLETMTDKSVDFWNGWINPYTGSHVDRFAVMVDLMYLSYGTNKDRAAEGEKGMVMIQKIIEECINVDEEKEPVYSGTIDPDEFEPVKSHEWSRSYVTEGVDLLAKRLEMRLGEGWKNCIADSIYQNLVEDASTSRICTLKASARFDPSDKKARKVATHMERKALSSRLTQLEASASEFNGDYEKTQRDMEALKEAMKKTCTSCKCVEAIVENLDLFGLVPMIQLKEIVRIVKEDFGGVCCYLFPKAQHGGAREIYVLDIKSRVIQLFVETVSRTICGYFSGETLTNPRSKLRLIDIHRSSVAEEASRSKSKILNRASSEDKTRWNQQIDVRVFHLICSKLLPSDLAVSVGKCLALWKEKKVLLPQGVINMMLEEVEIDNPTYRILCRSFYKKFEKDDPGSLYDLFENQGDKFMLVRMGMWQGILHYMSSLLHLVQAIHFKEQFLTIGQRYLETLATEVKLKCTSLVSSDDSLLLLSAIIPSSSPNCIAVAVDAYLSTWAKYAVKHCSYFNMKDSPKSCIGSTTVFEYNSTFMLKGGIVNPILKFVYAALSLTQTESLKKRLELCSNLLKDLVENGATSIQTACHQIIQGLFHYSSLGMEASCLFRSWAEILGSCPDPNLGFFLLTPHGLCGIMPFSYDHWKLLTNTIMPIVLTCPMAVKSNVKSAFTNKILIKHGDQKRSEMLVENTESEGWRDEVEKNPEWLFRSRVESLEELRAQISLLVTSPGVYESLRGGGECVAMFQSSVYILQAPCVTIGISEFVEKPEEEGEQVKTNRLQVVETERWKASLYYLTKKTYDEVTALAMARSATYAAGQPTDIKLLEDLSGFNRMNESLMKVLFPQSLQYSTITRKYCELVNSHVRMQCSLFRLKKNSINLRTAPIGSTTDPIRAFRNFWFQSGGLGRTTTLNTVNRFKEIFPWVCDKFEDTLINSPFTTPQEIVNFLVSFNPRSRACVPICKPLRSVDQCDKVIEFAKGSHWLEWQLVRPPRTLLDGAGQIKVKSRQDFFSDEGDHESYQEAATGAGPSGERGGLKGAVESDSEGESEDEASEQDDEDDGQRSYLVPHKIENPFMRQKERRRLDTAGSSWSESSFDSCASGIKSTSSKQSRAEKSRFKRDKRVSNKLAKDALALARAGLTKGDLFTALEDRAKELNLDMLKKNKSQEERKALEKHFGQKDYEFLEKTRKEAVISIMKDMPGIFRPENLTPTLNYFSTFKARVDQILTLPVPNDYKAYLLKEYIKTNLPLTGLSLESLVSLSPVEKKLGIISMFIDGSLSSPDIPCLVLSQAGGKFFYFPTPQARGARPGEWSGIGVIRIITLHGCVSVIINGEGVEALICDSKVTLTSMLSDIIEVLYELGIRVFCWTDSNSQVLKAQLEDLTWHGLYFDGSTIFDLADAQKMNPFDKSGVRRKTKKSYSKVFIQGEKSNSRDKFMSMDYMSEIIPLIEVSDRSISLSYKPTEKSKPHRFLSYHGRVNGTESEDLQIYSRENDVNLLEKPPRDVSEMKSVWRYWINNKSPPYGLILNFLAHIRIVTTMMPELSSEVKARYKRILLWVRSTLGTRLKMKGVGKVMTLLTNNLIKEEAEKAKFDLALSTLFSMDHRKTSVDGFNPLIKVLKEEQDKFDDQDFCLEDHFHMPVRSGSESSDDDAPPEHVTRGLAYAAEKRRTLANEQAHRESGPQHHQDAKSNVAQQSGSFFMADDGQGKEKDMSFFKAMDLISDIVVNTSNKVMSAHLKDGRSKLKSYEEVLAMTKEFFSGFLEEGGKKPDMKSIGAGVRIEHGEGRQETVLMNPRNISDYTAKFWDNFIAGAEKQDIWKIIYSNHEMPRSLFTEVDMAAWAVGVKATVRVKASGIKQFDFRAGLDGNQLVEMVVGDEGLEPIQQSVFQDEAAALPPDSQGLAQQHDKESDPPKKSSEVPLSTEKDDTT